MSLSPEVLEVLACPRCGSRLREREAGLVCTDQAHAWGCADDVPDFLGETPYWGEIPQEVMSEVVRRARTGDWREAAAWGAERAGSPGFRRNVEDPSRADWAAYVPLQADSWVLDVGSGCGNLTSCLARMAGRVFSLENVKERVQFSRLRWAQEGLANTQVIRGSILEPPFPPGRFDLVVMNGVLEWVGYSRVRRDPAAVQALALQRIFELLRPGGMLYVGIENRLGTFRNKDHLGLRYTSYMPRLLADLTHRLRGKGTYRVYTHTLSRYRRMFRKAGFSALETYMAVPSYTYPRYLIPADSRQAIRFFLDHMVPKTTPKRRLAVRVIGLCNRLGLVPHFAGQFAFFAKKHPA